MHSSRCFLSCNDHRLQFQFDCTVVWLRILHTSRFYTSKTNFTMMQRQSLCGFNKDLNDQVSLDPCIISQFSDQWISVVLTGFPFICQFFARQWFSSSYCQCNPLSVVNQSVRSSNYFQVSRVTVTHIVCLEMKTESLCCSHFCNRLHILHKFPDYFCLKWYFTYCMFIGARWKVRVILASLKNLV